MQQIDSMFNSMKGFHSNLLDGDPIRLLRQSIEVHLDRAMTPNSTRSVHRISPALSEQVVYCQAVSWSERVFNKLKDLSSAHQREFSQMSSIGETKLKKYTGKDHVKQFLDYNTWQISRTYPKELTQILYYRQI